MVIFSSSAAMKTVKGKAGHLFNKSTLLVLLRMVGATRRKTEVSDISKLQLRTKVATVSKWAGVGSRQTENILKEMVGAGVLIVKKRAHGELCYTLDISPLAGLESSADITKRENAKRLADRAKKARAVRAANRERDSLTRWAQVVRSRKGDLFAVVLGKRTTASSASVSAQ